MELDREETTEEDRGGEERRGEGQGLQRFIPLV